METLTGRPLLDTRSDVDLFVDRTQELRQLRGAVDSNLNALVLGDRGAGKTSLLRRLAYDLRQGKVPHLYVDGATPEDASSLLELIRYKLAGPRVSSTPEVLEPMLLRVKRDETQWILRLIEEIQKALSASGQMVILLDGAPSGRDAHTLFGRARDELWQLPASWVVAADADDRAEYLEPPADAFFESMVDLKPLTDEHARTLIRARVGPSELSDRRLEEVIPLAKGNPRRLITAARDGMDRSPASQKAKRQALEVELAKLGRPAAMLASELEALGGASASDERLLKRLGWTRGRAVQVLKQLEEKGIVTASMRSVDGGGRPRKVYELLMPLYG
jgi:hypothetical protein